MELASQLFVALFGVGGDAWMGGAENRKSEVKAAEKFLSQGSGSFPH